MKIYKNKTRKILGVATAILLATSAVSCVDETFKDCAEMEPIDGFAVQFRVSALSEGEEDDLSENTYEDYISPNSLRVLIFDENDKFLFEVKKKNIFNAESRGKAYYVRMSGTELDEYLAEYEDGDKPILDKNFKAAVLANWPESIEGRRYTYTSDVSSDPFVRNEEWLYNSELEQGDDLFKLSHLAYDNVYGPLETPIDGPYEDTGSNPQLQQSVFQHLVLQESDDMFARGGGKMGVYSVWVDNFHHSSVDAEIFIRNLDSSVDWELIPNAQVLEGGDYHTRSMVSYKRNDRRGSYKIKDVWKVWNFSNGNEDILTYNTDNARAKSFWKKQNEDLLTSPLARGDNFNDLDGLSFTGTSSYDQNEGYVTVNAGSVSTTGGGGGWWGDMGDPVTTMQNNYFHFRVKGEGIVRVVADRTNGQDPQEGDILVRTSPPNSQNTTDSPLMDYDDDMFVELTSTGAGVYRFMADPSMDEYLDVYVYANGRSMNIYEVGFIATMKVYDADRINVKPDRDHLIPMYGVQEFEPIRDYLTPNTLFNLSDPSLNTKLTDADGNEYKWRDVFMLRSVAKVELLIDKNLLSSVDAAHVFMRSMNRSARCEPIDVWTPTNLLWYGSDFGNYPAPFDNGNYSYLGSDNQPKYTSILGINTERSNIKSYGPFYDASYNEATESSFGETFRRKSAWYYGVWRNEKDWDWGIYHDKNQYNPNNSPQYPRVFNPRVDRSDLTHFIEAGEEGGFKKYVLYMPEKCTDDPDSRGRLSSGPMIPHIELRFEDKYGNELTDNNSIKSHGAYRIYFTDYNNGEPNDLLNRNRDGYSENYANLIAPLYPIIRNHVYRFKVTGLNPNEINFQICDPAGRTAHNITFN